eukprot:762899-Hanusia_phi.AAC.5
MDIREQGAPALEMLNVNQLLLKHPKPPKHLFIQERKVKVGLFDRHLGGLHQQAAHPALARESAVEALADEDSTFLQTIRPNSMSMYVLSSPPLTELPFPLPLPLSRTNQRRIMQKEKRSDCRREDRTGQDRTGGGVQRLTGLGGSGKQGVVPGQLGPFYTTRNSVSLVLIV